MRSWQTSFFACNLLRKSVSRCLKTSDVNFCLTSEEDFINDSLFIYTALVYVFKWAAKLYKRLFAYAVVELPLVHGILSLTGKSKTKKLVDSHLYRESECQR